MPAEIANAPANEFAGTERVFQQLADSAQLPKPLVRDVVSWRKNLWRRQRGYVANSGDILRELPPALRVEVLWSSCIDSLLQVPQLAALRSGGAWRRQLGLLASLLSSLEQRFCVPGEVLFSQGQAVAAYFLLTEGSVELQGSHRRAIRARCLITTADATHAEGCIATTFCVVQCLDKDVFQEQLSNSHSLSSERQLQAEEHESKVDPPSASGSLASEAEDSSDSWRQGQADWLWFESGGRAESMWTVLRCLSHFYFAVMVPLRIGFALRSDSFAAFGQWSLVIDACCDVLAWTEIFVLRRLCFTVIDEATGRVIPPPVLWRQYTSSVFGLALDLATVCPLDYLCLLHSFELLFWARLLRLLPMWNFSAVYDTLLDKLESLIALPLPRSALAILKQLLLMWLFAHSMGSLWFFVAHWEDSDLSWTNRGLKYIITAATCAVDIDPALNSTTGICPLAAESSGPVYNLPDLYVISSYYMFTIMSTVGYGDILPGTTLETALVCFIMFYGCYLFGGVTGSLASVVSNVDVTAELHSGRSEQLVVFAKHRRLPESLSRRLEAYMQELWSSFLGAAPNLTLKDLPSSLKEQVAWHRFGAIVSRLPLFQGCVDLPGGVAMIQDLCASIESRLFAAPTISNLELMPLFNETQAASDVDVVDDNFHYLAVCGRYCDAMFVLVNGSAEVLADHRPDRPVPVVDTSALVAGRLEADAAAGSLAWFGERHLTSGVPQLMAYSVRATARCETLVLRHVHLCRSVQKHTGCRLCSKQSSQINLVSSIQANLARQSAKSTSDVQNDVTSAAAAAVTTIAAGAAAVVHKSSGLVQPETSWRHWWELASLWLLVWYAFTVPAMAAFTGTSSLRAYWLFVSASYAVDVFFWLDVFRRLRVFLPIESDDQVLVSDPQSLTQLMVKKYPLRLALDLLACVPIDIAALLAWTAQGTSQQGSGGVTSWLALYRLNKLLFMHRLPAQWARVAWYAPLHVNDPLPFVFGFAENRFCKQLLKFLLVLDWIAVTWFVIGLNHAEFEVLSWVQMNSLVTAATPTGRYVWSVYWSVVTASTVGYGDITPQNIGEILFWFGAMLVGQILFADIIGSISLRQSALHSTQLVELDHVEQLKAGLLHLRAPLRMCRQIVRQLRHSSERQDRPPLQVAEQLPESLLAEMKSNVNSLFFTCVPHLAVLANGPCGAALASLLQRVKYAHGEVVEPSATAAKRISVLVRGKLWRCTDLQAAVCSCLCSISYCLGLDCCADCKLLIA